MKSEYKDSRNVYLDVKNEQIDVYHHVKQKLSEERFLTIPLDKSDSLNFNTIVLKKQSLDIDVTSILLKCRPSVFG